MKFTLVAMVASWDATCICTCRHARYFLHHMWKGITWPNVHYFLYHMWKRVTWPNAHYFLHHMWKGATWPNIKSWIDLKHCKIFILQFCLVTWLCSSQVWTSYTIVLCYKGLRTRVLLFEISEIVGGLTCLFNFFLQIFVWHLLTCLPYGLPCALCTVHWNPASCFLKLIKIETLNSGWITFLLLIYVYVSCTACM